MRELHPLFLDDERPTESAKSQPETTKMASNDSAGQPDNDGRTVIGANSKLTLGFVISVLSILTPMVVSFFFLFRQQAELRNSIGTVEHSINDKFGMIDERILALQAQLNDRWTRSMMVLFTTELALRNATNLIVPKAEDIADRMPPSAVVFPSRSLGTSK